MGVTSKPRFADIRQSKEGDTCPHCGGSLRFQTAIEVGHIFKLGTRYSAPLGAKYLDESGQERPLVMGSYGIGPGRMVAAAVEQGHDEHGISWPRSLAPVRRPCRRDRCRRQRSDGHGRAPRGRARGRRVSVLLDDRDRRPGEKFADADLLGCPVRVTVGKKTLEDGKVDVLRRATAPRNVSTSATRRTGSVGCCSRGQETEVQRGVLRADD